jgi:hypothetical protein
MHMKIRFTTQVDYDDLPVVPFCDRCFKTPATNIVQLRLVTITPQVW